MFSPINNLLGTINTPMLCAQMKTVGLRHVNGRGFSHPLAPLKAHTAVFDVGSSNS